MTVVVVAVVVVVVVVVTVVTVVVVVVVQVPAVAVGLHQVVTDRQPVEPQRREVAVHASLPELGAEALHHGQQLVPLHRG